MSEQRGGVGTGVVSDLSYESAVTELEAIIAYLDRGLVDIDTLSERFGRAIEIVEELDRRITRAREQVAVLAPRLEAIGEEDL